MGRTVLANENLVEHLCNISKIEGIVPGLILGQCDVPGQKDYVVHLPKTSYQVGDQSDINGFQNLMDIDENVISEHARTVTRMLPGGMWVLGFYIISPGDLFTDKNALTKLRSIGHKIHNCTKGNDFMNGKDPTSQKLILHFSSTSKKYICKTLEMDNLNSSMRPVDWKFKPYTTSWLQVESAIDFNWMPSFSVTRSVNTKKKLQECLSKFKANLDSLTYSINGNFCDEDQLLSTVDKRVKEPGDGEENHEHYYLMFFECMEPLKDNIKTEKPLKIEEDSLLSFNGMITSCVYLHEKSTAKDALLATKDDLIRSLASRLEMHWKTTEDILTIESKYLLRSPPKRMLVKPEGSEVGFYEYVFEGETEDDALLSITENLGFLDCQISAVENDLDPDNNINKEKNLEEVPKDVTPLSIKLSKQSSNSFLVYGITASCVTLFFSLLVNFFYS